MNYPHMTPRRWLWSYMAAGLLWSFAGTRWDPGWMHTFQYRTFEQPADLLLTPAEFVFKEIQQSARYALRGTKVNDGKEDLTNEALREKIRELENSLAQATAWNAEHEQQLAAYGQLQLAGITGNVVKAGVVGYQASPGASLLRLDKGSGSGITVDSPVIFASVETDPALQGVTLVGRVDKVGVGECVVQLLSDPSSKVTAQIIRPQIRPPGNPRITVDPILVYGLGSNAMEMRDMNVQLANPPQKGDLVQLLDNRYPEKAQYMVIGQIDDVGHRTDNALRYELHITPRVAITSIHSVMVLSK